MKPIRMTITLLLVVSTIVIAYSVTATGQSSNSLEEEAIKKVIAATTDAFNRHDAKAFARSYTPDAELVTVRGERLRGAAEIENGLAGIFATRAKSATLKMLDTTIRFIRPDVAVEHVTNEMIGVMNTAGEKQPSHRELSIRVMVKDKGTWRVSAFHNTIISSPGR